ncbi:MAG TPA: hypothetical protein VGN97_21790 [Mesorhizobium sp.]|jgi:hypothetical protein|nr:hypothetical protein [Mesorhizobium sp.]
MSLEDPPADQLSGEEPMADAATKARTRKGANAGFFAVDRRAWAFACDRGLLPAAAYLVQACGTGGDNRTTRWSANAVETYTGASRGRASAAVKDLVTCGLSRLTEAGTRPRYHLSPAHQVPGCEGHRPALTSLEQFALTALEAGAEKLSPERIAALEGESAYMGGLRLVAKGYAQNLKGGRFQLLTFDASKAAEPDWIWLPNTIVTGAAGETPPLALLRAAQSVAALRLFVNLYGAHSLAENGGIHWKQLRRTYSRHKVGERGEFIVWGFQAKLSEAWASAPFVAPHLTGKMESFEEEDGTIKQRDAGWTGFWEAENVLINLGLLEVVGHVIEADTDTAEVLHPYAVGNGEPVERALAEIAHLAGEALVTPGQAEWAAGYGLWLLPVAKGLLPNVALVGIPRLKYRPRTKATAAWFARHREWVEWQDRYLAIATKATADLQHQGKIKVVSR